ncbi:hypothetical protein C7R91_05440 [Brevibacillus formosus]|nr:hypothetical protein C7R91_05440 [Brevibacillus formosus]
MTVKHFYSTLLHRSYSLYLCLFKKSSFQHRENGENLKKEERSVGDLHEHRTSMVNAIFDVE